MDKEILKCENLWKSYRGGYPVLKNFSLELAQGKIVGLLGPNGCGKSTLIKLIAGLLVADRGKIYVAGEERSEKSAALISYLPERTYFNGSMTVEELIDFFVDFYPDFDRHEAQRMLGELGVPMLARLRTLSKGTKEKVQLVMVMSRRARLYLLDEPIAGVDPAARDYILDTIIKNHNPESTVVITTHLIHDVEPVLDEFMFMGRCGEIKLGGVSEDVRREYGKTLDELFREVFKC